MDPTDTSSSDLLGGYITDFASSALNGLGLGNGAQAAQTVGALIRPTAVSATPPPPTAPTVKGPAISIPKLSTTQLVALGLGIAVVGYLIVRK